MITADTHCDTMTEIFDKNISLYRNNLHTDILRMKKFSHCAQFFACWISPENRDQAKNYALAVIDNFMSEAEKYKEHIEIAKSHEDYARILKTGKISAFLSIEGGEVFENTEDVRLFYDLGVRAAALTWNYDNKIAGGVEGDKKQGLTVFGKNIVLKMNELKMIVDTSHLNEKSFWDIAELSPIPIAATHSNSFALCENPRNLKDEQFREITKRGGYVGINLYPPFLGKEESVTLCYVLKHIEHFLELGGEDTIGLGCDFDGVSALPEGISGIEDIHKLFDEMSKIGYSDDLIHKIAHKNFEKLIKLF